MADAFARIFSVLKPVLAKNSKRLAVKTDTAGEYTVVTKAASPFPQHKGQPMFFGSVKAGRAYVSLHLMPLYMCPALTKSISPALKKRMQGKTCFNFKHEPAAELIAELSELAEAGIRQWSERKWM